MPSARVVPTLYPSKDSQPCFGLGFPAAPGNQLALQAGKQTLGHGVVISIAHSSHGWAHTHFLAPAAKGNAGVLGVFNRSSQHLNHGSVYGTTRRVDAEVDGSRSDALAGRAVASARIGARVLGADCDRNDEQEGDRSGRRVAENQ